MKYLLALVLFSTLALAQDESFEEIEVGSPRDCVVVGSKNDTAITNDLNQIQHQITDCLAPQEEQVSEDQAGNRREIVSQ
jgi:hypothetical protein